jgi:type I restriction-modification system DNA methylase subunit
MVLTKLRVAEQNLTAYFINTLDSGLRRNDKQKKSRFAAALFYCINKLLSSRVS